MEVRMAWALRKLMTFNRQRIAMSIAHFKTDEELLKFARKVFANRIDTFRKDIAIC